MVDGIKDLINELPKTDNNGESAEFMGDESYVESCQDIMNEALQKGYDIIHMENGDIITTGTKVVVTQYRWDPEEGKMVKIMSKQK